MKKVIACLLAVCLLMQLPFQVLTSYAAEVSGNNLGETDSPVEVTPLKSHFKVKLVSFYDFTEGKSFTVTLGGQGVQKISLTKEGNDACLSGTAVFEGLEKGTYTLTVEADQYAVYSQDITIADDGLEYRVELYTSYHDVKYYLERENGAGKHPGVIPLGDVSDPYDGEINEEDNKALIRAMGSKGSGLHEDLNGDGTVDLADLQYLSQSLGKERLLSDVFTTVLSENIDVAGLEGTTISLQEDMKLQEAIFEENDAVVTLQPAKEESISENNPVEMDLTIADEKSKGVPMEAIVIKSPEGTGNGLQSGAIRVEYEENGKIQHMDYVFGDAASKSYHVVGTAGIPGIGTGAANTVSVENGSLVVELGKQVAVKKVTIRVTGTTNHSNLAEISQVEFLNNMEDRIPAPQLSIPADLRYESGSKSFNLYWNAQVNITGYEVEIIHLEKGSSNPSGPAWTFITDTNSLSVTAFNGEELKNYDTYRVRVRSVNAEWRSDYSVSIDAVPKPTSKPAPPDNVVAAAGMGSIEVRWKKMKDTLSYTVYYEEKNQPSTRQSVAAESNSCTIYLPSSAVKTYTVWVTGTNELGEGAASLKSNVTTTSISPVEFPEYMLFTTPRKDVRTGLLDHVKSASWNTHDTRTKGMYGSTLDTNAGTGSALGLVDNDFGSYYHIADWDDGCIYGGQDKGVTVRLTEKHEMNMIMFADIVDNTYYNAALYYLDGEGREVRAENLTVSSRVDGQGRRYHIIKLFDPIKTDQVRICLERSGGARSIGISEIRFYDYDPIEREVMDLFEDSMHLVLKKGVTLAKIDELRRKVHSEHPYRAMILSELDTAEKILKDADALKNVEVVTIEPSITGKKDGHLGFGGLNSWQPLGITAYAGEELVIYVGHEGKNTGAATELQVVVTQYHAESTPFKQVLSQKLKVGQNLVTVPEIASFDFEKGGSVYIQYTGNNPKDVYGVRVKGGQSIPVLNLYNVEAGGADWLARTEVYVKELEKHVDDQEKLHDKVHKNETSPTVNYEYDRENCILGATEIMMDQMMLSVSGEQILKGLGEGSVHEKAVRLSQSLQAMEEMMTLFYQHKGLSNAADSGVNNKLPAQHLNIRYHRMFAGAFMYASGDHIGIEWGSVPGLSAGVPVTVQNGKYVSGNYFGWGIAHEIGHDINQGTYAIAEVTNNYFAVLAQAKETNESVRFQYENVYDKVTSGVTGRSSNVFTQLGMYWQLHLAYDKGYNYKIYDSYKEQLSNLFFARVDTYARNVAAAPKTEIPLALNNLDAQKKPVEIDIDQKLMRLASAAAQKDLTEFFVRWGMVPDEETLRYMSQYEKEDRAIYYVNDEARAYAVEHSALMETETVQGKDVVGKIGLAVSPDAPNQVVLSLANTAQYPEAVLGYEITRCMTSGGKVEKKVVGFTTDATFVDTISSINNRVFTYEVTVVDKFLNRSAAKALEPVKISHDGSYDKTYWKVTTNMVSESDVDAKGTKEDPCDPEIESGIILTVDDQMGSVYTGSTLSEDPVVVLELNELTGITGLKYTAPEENRITDYTIQISGDGENWKTIGKGSFQKKDGAEIVYFRNERKDPWVCTYDASYVRLIADGQGGKNISIGEIDLLGPTGDNVEFLAADPASPAFGYLEEDFIYDDKGNKIPKGSLVFVGQYKGNPAYNVVILYDAEGNIVGGTDKNGELTAHQIILAEVPDQGELGETSDGRFIYWIEPSAGVSPSAPQAVRAELYRVDNALNNEGQRLVSDTKLTELTEHLPKIKLSRSES